MGSARRRTYRGLYWQAATERYLPSGTVASWPRTWFWRKRGIVVMSSRSRDAEYVGRFIKRFGYGTARGSATRGGGRALAEMAECLSNDMDVGFTINGPRGPAYVAKPGAVTLARHTGQAILPFHIAARRYVELPSWDRLQIPLPFTRAVAIVAEPIYVARRHKLGRSRVKTRGAASHLKPLAPRSRRDRKALIDRWLCSARWYLASW